MNVLGFIMFILVFSSILFGMHYYVYARIVYGLLIPSNYHIYFRLSFLLLGLSFFGSMTISRYSSSIWLKPISTIGVIWLGIISISLTIFVVNDFLRLFFRTQAFRYYSTVISLIILFGVTIFSVINVARKPVIKELFLKYDNLPASLSGFTVVQLSDIHLNLSKSEKWIRSVVQQTNELNPDVVVITGDLIDADLCKYDGFCETLAGLKPKYGVYAVSGNHEYYSGLNRFIDIAKNSGIKILRNITVPLNDSILVAGIDDKEMIKPKDGLEKALGETNIYKNKFLILLSHQPDVFDEAVKYGVDLQLSGHTHAGQIPPLDLIVMLVFKYPYGLYKNGSSYLYTTSGTGVWGPPMRLFSRCEIVKIVLGK